MIPLCGDFSLGLWQLGLVFTSWLIDHVAVGVIFIPAGNLAAIVGLLSLLHPTIRTLNETRTGQFVNTLQVQVSH